MTRRLRARNCAVEAIPDGRVGDGIRKPTRPLVWMERSRHTVDRTPLMDFERVLSDPHMERGPDRQLRQSALEVAGASAIAGLATVGRWLGRLRVSSHSARMP